MIRNCAYGRMKVDRAVWGLTSCCTGQQTRGSLPGHARSGQALIRPGRGRIFSCGFCPPSPIPFSFQFHCKQTIMKAKQSCHGLPPRQLQNMHSETMHAYWTSGAESGGSDVVTCHGSVRKRCCNGHPPSHDLGHVLAGLGKNAN